jgi:hypothetical protein
LGREDKEIRTFSLLAQTCGCLFAEVAEMLRINCLENILSFGSMDPWVLFMGTGKTTK